MQKKIVKLFLMKKTKRKNIFEVLKYGRFL